MMNILKKSVCVGLAVIALTACQSSKEKLNERIALLEKEAAAGYSVEKNASLLQVYAEYIGKFPQDSLSGEYLFKSGTVNMSMRKGDEALSNFKDLINKFPRSPYLPEACYYTAFIYEDIIYDIIAAEVAYKNFIERYPEHKLVTDAKLSIKYLGKSPEEIIASFEEKEQNTATE